MNSAIDQNSKATITARLNTDGVTVTKIKINPANSRLKVNDSTGGTAATDAWAATDDNERPTMFVVSNADGVTLVALLADSSGNLLINSH
jgi:hypothetical protein